MNNGGNLKDSCWRLKIYTVLGGRNDGFVLSPDQVTVQSRAITQKQVLTRLRSRSASVNALKLPILKLSRKIKPYANCAPCFVTRASTAQVLLGVKPTGCALLHGVHGSGKSTLLHALVDEVQNSLKFANFTTTAEGRNLRIVALYELLNFGSGFRKNLHKYVERGAHDTIVFGLIGMYISVPKLDAQFLQHLSIDLVASYFVISLEQDEGFHQAFTWQNR
ncbi:hypothetical protein PsorP6_018205 [Peronosclerospora sorghi]|uniref:Uncharacterized protein n=1 Tax=Peronosclerospora sorghi TaxID=230839 RepID=A0ACC0WEV8_9STRA|nr:hypothetical protein PsorP6_018205 [Peronosclerospora sorghi]